jgi:hypothetical protein
VSPLGWIIVGALAIALIADVASISTELRAIRKALEKLAERKEWRP